MMKKATADTHEFRLAMFELECLVSMFFHAFFFFHMCVSKAAETQDAESAFGSDSSSVLEWKPSESLPLKSNLPKPSLAAPTTRKPLRALHVQVRDTEDSSDRLGCELEEFSKKIKKRKKKSHRTHVLFFDNWAQICLKLIGMTFL